MKPNYLFLWILMAGAMVSAQVSFKAVPDKTTAKIGDRIQLSYIITTSRNLEINQITFPSFSGFQMLGRNSSESFNYTNGRTTRQIMETVILMPQKQGKITVNPASIMVDGERVQSNSVTFTITKADPKKENQSNSLVFMNIELSKNEVYPNETLLASVKLYARSFDALRRRSEIEVPGISDFQVVQLSKNQERDFEQVAHNNQVYISEKIAEFQLTPKSTGQLVIPPFKLRVAVPLDFFEEKIIPVATDVKTVIVKDFPANAPAAFAGAVGDFEFNTHLENNDLSINESVDYEVELIGEGNFSSIKLPKIKVPDEIEIYPPKTRNSYQTTLAGEKGKIAESYVLVPQYGGEFKIPALEFTFFNPESGKYKTITTPVQQLNVAGETKEEIRAAQQEKLAKENDTINKSAIDKTIDLIPNIPREITGIFDGDQAENNVEAVTEEGMSWWYLLAVIPVIGLGYLFFTSRNKKPKKRERNPNHVTQVFDYKPILRNDLSELKSLALKDNGTEFFKRSQKLLNNVVVFINKEQRIYDVVEARKILTEKKSDGFAHRWERLYNEIQIMNYGQINEDSELMKVYDAIESLIKELLK